MTQLVTLDETKIGLRIDGSDNDVLLTNLIGAASGAVINYLKADADTELFDFAEAEANNPDAADVPDYIKQATILLVDYYQRGDFEGAEPGYLPPHVTALLWGKRTPTIA